MQPGTGSVEYDEHFPITPLIQARTFEEALFRSRSGEKYWIIRQRKEQAYIQLDERDYFLWSRMDGTRTIPDLIEEYLYAYRALPFDRLIHLIKVLTDHGFLISHEHSDRDIGTGDDGSNHRWYEAFWELIVPLPYMDLFFSSLYQVTGWIFRIRYLPVLFVLFCSAGLGYFLITEPLPSYPVLLAGDSDFLTIISIYAIILCSAFLHECGHALACRAYGRTIRDAGLLLYYGSPCMYIDTSDIWMAPRRARIMVSLAGPAVNIFIGSLCSLTVLVLPDSGYSTFVWRIGFICYCIAFINLNPLLEFDGYYALSDLLEIPDLRSRAFSYIRSFSLIKYAAGRDRGDRNGLIYILYGVSSGLFTLTLVIVGIYVWESHVAALVTELQKDVWVVDNILATVAIIAIFIPFLLGMMISGGVYLRKRIIALRAS